MKVSTGIQTPVSTKTLIEGKLPGSMGPVQAYIVINWQRHIFSGLNGDI